MVIKPLSAILYQVEVVMRVITADDQLLELVPGDRSVIEKSLSTIYAPHYPPTVSGLFLWPSRVMRSRHPCNTPVYCTGGWIVNYEKPSRTHPGAQTNLLVTNIITEIKRQSLIKTINFISGYAANYLLLPTLPICSIWK